MTQRSTLFATARYGALLCCLTVLLGALTYAMFSNVTVHSTTAPSSVTTVETLSTNDASVGPLPSDTTLESDNDIPAPATNARVPSAHTLAIADASIATRYQRVNIPIQEFDAVLDRLSTLKTPETEPGGESDDESSIGSLEQKLGVDGDQVRALFETD